MEGGRHFTGEFARATGAPSQAMAQALGASPMLVSLYDRDDWLAYANRAYRETFLRGYDGTSIRFDDVLRLGFRGGFGVKVNSGDIEAFLADILPRRRALAGSRSIEVDTVTAVGCGSPRPAWMTAGC